MAKPWTPDDLVVLRRNYGSRTNAWLCEYLERDEADVEAKANELQLAKDKRRFKGRKMPRWSETEVKLLRERYPTRANVEIARELGRSVKSVVSKAHALQLRKDEQRLQEMGRQNVELRRDRDSPAKS